MPLNYTLIKRKLLEKSEKISVICSLLQALSWRLEYTNRYSSREQLVDMTECDIFDLKKSKLVKKNNNEIDTNLSLSPLLDNLLNKLGLKIKQYVVRLINTIASDSIGRS